MPTEPEPDREPQFSSTPTRSDRDRDRDEPGPSADAEREFDRMFSDATTDRRTEATERDDGDRDRGDSGPDLDVRTPVPEGTGAGDVVTDPSKIDISPRQPKREEPTPGPSGGGGGSGSPEPGPSPGPDRAEADIPPKQREAAREAFRKQARDITLIERGIIGVEDIRIGDIRREADRRFTADVTLAESGRRKLLSREIQKIPEVSGFDPATLNIDKQIARGTVEFDTGEVRNLVADFDTGDIDFRTQAAEADLDAIDAGGGADIGLPGARRRRRGPQKGIGGFDFEPGGEVRPGSTPAERAAGVSVGAGETERGQFTRFQTIPAFGGPGPAADTERDIQRTIEAIERFPSAFEAPTDTGIDADIDRIVRDVEAGPAGGFLEAERTLQRRTTGEPVFTFEGFPLLPSPTAGTGLLGATTKGKLAEGAVGAGVGAGAVRLSESIPGGEFRRKNREKFFDDIEDDIDDLEKQLGVDVPEPVESAAVAGAVAGTRGAQIGGVGAGGPFAVGFAAGAAVEAADIGIPEDADAFLPTELGIGGRPTSEIPAPSRPAGAFPSELPTTGGLVDVSELRTPKEGKPVSPSELSVPSDGVAGGAALRADQPVNIQKQRDRSGVTTISEKLEKELEEMERERDKEIRRLRGPSRDIEEMGEGNQPALPESERRFGEEGVFGRVPVEEGPGLKEKEGGGIFGEPEILPEPTRPLGERKSIFRELTEGEQSRLERGQRLFPTGEETVIGRATAAEKALEANRQRIEGQLSRQFEDVTARGIGPRVRSTGVLVGPAQETGQGTATDIDARIDSMTDQLQAQLARQGLMGDTRLDQITDGLATRPVDQTGEVTDFPVGRPVDTGQPSLFDTPDKFDFPNPPAFEFGFEEPTIPAFGTGFGFGIQPPNRPGRRKRSTAIDDDLDRDIGGFADIFRFERTRTPFTDIESQLKDLERDMARFDV